MQASIHPLLLTDPVLTTCRARRIRCDESFPVCFRCVSADRVCDGYGIWGGGSAVYHDIPTGSTQQQHLELIKRFKGPTDKETLHILAASPNPGPRISTEEQYYFEWMFRGTAAHAPHVFASPFWAPIFPSATMEAPVVTQALLALSAAYKRKVLDPESRARQGLTPDAQEAFMLKQYCGSMRSLHMHLHDKGVLDRSQLLLAVLTCSIFVLVEGTRGNYEATNIHATSGMQLTQKLAEMSGDRVTDNNNLRFFAIVKDQMEAFRRRRDRPEAHISTLMNAEATVRFNSPTDAKQHLDAVVVEIVQAVEQVQSIQHPTAALRTQRKIDHTFFLASFEAWYLAFKTTIADKATPMTPEDALEWKAVEQQYYVDKVFAETEFQPNLKS
jgi:hypothetical protein